MRRMKSASTRCSLPTKSSGLLFLYSPQPAPLVCLRLLPPPPSVFAHGPCCAQGDRCVVSGVSCSRAEHGCSNKLAAKGPAKAAVPLAKKDHEKQVAEVRSHYQKKIKDLQHELRDTQEQLASAKSALERRGKGSPRLAWGVEAQSPAVQKSEVVQGLEQRISQARQRIPRTPVKGQECDEAAQSSGEGDSGDVESGVATVVGHVLEGKGGADTQSGGAGGLSDEVRTRRGAPVEAERWAVPRAGDAGRVHAGREPGDPDQSVVNQDNFTQRRVLELENQLRILKAELGDGGMMGPYGTSGRYDGGMDVERQLFVMQRRLAESERARELAQMTLQAVEDGAKSVMEEAQGHAQKRIKEITKHFVLRGRGEGSLHEASAGAARTLAKRSLPAGNDVSPETQDADGMSDSTAAVRGGGAGEDVRGGVEERKDDVLALRLKVTELERLVRGSLQGVAGEKSTGGTSGQGSASASLSSSRSLNVGATGDGKFWPWTLTFFWVQAVSHMHARRASSLCGGGIVMVCLLCMCRKGGRFLSVSG